MVHGGMTLVKYLLFLFNFIFWLTGIGITVVGAVIQIKYSEYINFLGNTLLSVPIMLICVGVTVSLLGFFGCCGAIRENYCMTMSFAVLLGVIFIVELAAGIASYVLRNDVESIIKTHSKSGMSKYNQTTSEGVTKAWDSLQENLACCGIDNYLDWSNSTAYANTNSVPDSCCRGRVREGCAEDVLAGYPMETVNQTIHTMGCAEPLKDYVVHNAAIVGGVGMGVAFVQVLGICFACCLSKSILKDYEDYYY